MLARPLIYNYLQNVSDEWNEFLITKLCFIISIQLPLKLSIATFFYFHSFLNPRSRKFKMSDPSEVFRIPFKIIKVLGLWQEKNSSWPYRFLGFLVQFMCIDLITLFQFLYFFHFEDFQSLSDCITTFPTTLSQVVKSLTFIYELKNIQLLVENLKDLIKLSECEVTKNHPQISKVIRRVRIAYNSLLVTAVFSCTIAGLVPIMNRKQHQLAYRMHFPWLDFKNNDTIFILLALYQMVPVFVCVLITSIGILPVFCMCFATGLIEELTIRLEKIGTKTEGPKTKEEEDFELAELLKCIEIHQGIKKFVNDTQRIFSTLILLECVMSSFVFCTTAFMLSLVSFKHHQNVS